MTYKILHSFAWLFQQNVIFRVGNFCMVLPGILTILKNISVIGYSRTMLISLTYKKFMLNSEHLLQKSIICVLTYENTIVRYWWYEF